MQAARPCVSAKRPHRRVDTEDLASARHFWCAPVWSKLQSSWLTGACGRQTVPPPRPRSDQPCGTGARLTATKRERPRQAGGRQKVSHSSGPLATEWRRFFRSTSLTRSPGCHPARMARSTSRCVLRLIFEKRSPDFKVRLRRLSSWGVSLRCLLRWWRDWKCCCPSRLVACSL